MPSAEFTYFTYIPTYLGTLLFAKSPVLRSRLTHKNAVLAPTPNIEFGKYDGDESNWTPLGQAGWSREVRTFKKRSPNTRSSDVTNYLNMFNKMT